jgi:antitoxin YefM
MAISASEARAQLFPLIEKVSTDHVPVEITSRNGRAVLMSAEDYESWQETVYLLRSPRNAQLLMESIAELDAGRGQVRELLETGDEETSA